MRLKRVLHVPDVHSPFHDKTAWKLFLSIAKDFKPDIVVIHGDFFDFYSVSRHDKDPLVDFKLWKDEMKEARCVLADIESLKARTQVFLEGNHEKRLQNYISNECPKLSGIYKTPELLGLDESWLYLPYGQDNHYKIGKLICTHGSRAGENPAASMVKKYRSSVAFGHTHRIQEYSIKNAHGEEFVGLNIGWLGSERRAAEYIKDFADWSHGFMLSWHRDNGSFYYQLIKIQHNKTECSALFGGEVYSA